MTYSKLKWCASDLVRPNSYSFLAYFLLPVFIAVFLISLFPDFLPTVFGAYSDQRFFQLGLLLVSAVVALVWAPSIGENQKLLSTSWPVFLVSAAFLLLTIPSSFGEHTWVEPGMYALYFVSFALMGWRIHEQGLSQFAAVALVYVATIGCFFYAAMTMTVYFFAIADEFSELTDIIPWGFVNMRYWSHIATWLLPILPLALMYGSFSKNRLWHIGVSFTAAIWWWMIFMTTARGSMLSIVLAGFVAFLLYGRAVFPWLMISFRFIVFGGLAWLLFSLAIPSIGAEEVTVRALKAGSSGRIPLWLEAWCMSLHHFPFGMGAQSWITHQAISEGFPSSTRLGHPHNMYLMWAAEYGWLLLITLGTLIAITLSNLVTKAGQIRAFAYKTPEVLIAFTASAVAGLVHAGFSAVFIVPASMLVGFLLLTVFWALSLPNGRPAESPSKQATPCACGNGLVIFLAVAIVTGGLVWMNQVWRYHEAMVVDLSQYQERPNAAYWPRFWFHGNFPRPEN
ncbi:MULTISPECIES: O-antigen ligase family protein [Marinobacter]|nr:MULTISPECIES: O-antigen ligase family protein [Marinobacter]